MNLRVIRCGGFKRPRLFFSASENATFRDEYKKRFNVAPTPFAETSYASIMMLAQGVNDTKSTKPADLQKGFNAVPPEPF